MTPARTTSRLVSAIALLGIVLRVLVPALHTHRHEAAAAVGGDAVVAVCSCGIAHGSHGEVERGGDSVDAAPDEHFCLACAIEDGTPADCPPQPDRHAPGIVPEGHAVRAARAVLCASQVRLPATRAPPDDEV